MPIYTNAEERFYDGYPHHHPRPHIGRPHDCLPVHAQLGVGPLGAQAFDVISQSVDTWLDEHPMSTRCFYRKLEDVYVTESDDDVTTIDVPIDGYSPAADTLFVDVNGLMLVEGVDYAINSDSITLSTPIEHAGTVVHFIALRAVEIEDYDALRGPQGIQGPQGPQGPQGVSQFASFANPIEWNRNHSYISNTIVLHDGNSFLSLRTVPSDVDIMNTDYWAEIGNYNAQVEEYRRETLAVANQLSEINVHIDAFSIVTPEMFGGVGDGIADDTTAIRDAYAYAKSHKLLFVMNKIYKITDTITFDSYSVYAENATIKVAISEKDRPAFIVRGHFCTYSFGTIIDNDSWHEGAIVHTDGWHGWNYDDYCAVKVNGFGRSVLRVMSIVNFTSAVMLESGPNGNSQYVAWSVFDIYSMRNCRYGYFIRNIGEGAWTNANTFRYTEYAFEGANTPFATSPQHRYFIYQELINFTTRSSFSTNIFYLTKVEHHFNSPVSYAYFCNAYNCLFDSCGLEYSTIDEVDITFDFTNNDITSYRSMGNKLSNWLYMQPTLKVLRKENNPNVRSQLSKYNILNMFNLDYVKEFDFMGQQIQIASNKTLLKYGSYATLYYGNGSIEESMNLVGTLSSIMTAEHLTTNPHTGCPCILVKIENENTIIKLESNTQLPYLRLFDSNRQLVSSANNVFADAVSYANRVHNESADYYIPRANENTVELSFSSTVAYVLLICQDASSLVIKSNNKIITYTYSDVNTAYTYDGLKSTVVPTTNKLPPYTKIWDFRNTESLGGYWLYEKVNDSYSWVYYN